MRVRLIVDFRDAWASNPIRRLRFPKTRVPIESWLERRVVKTADLGISTTEGITDDFHSRYPTQPREKFILIPNGYDREEFEETEIVERTCPRKLRVVHVGRLTWERSPRRFFQGLSLLVKERSCVKQEMELFLIGESARSDDGKCVEDYIEDYKLANMVTLTGHVPRAEAIQHVINVDILLLIVGRVPEEEIHTYGVSSKVFDYMMTGKPILALADDGPMSRIVEKTKIGYVVRPKDVRGMKQYLASSVEKYKNGGLDIRANMEEVGKYDIRVLTKTLAQLFDGRPTGVDNRKATS